MKLAHTALLAGLGALAACADYYPPAPPPGPPPPGAAAPAASAAPLADGCFRSADIDAQTVADDHTLYLRVANRDVYRLEMSGPCLSGVGPSDPLVIREPPGVPYACRPLDLDVSIARGGLGSGAGTTPCIVQTMTRLTADEAAALPERVRP